VLLVPVVDPRLLSRCGIYCGACFIYRAQRDRGSLLEAMSRRFGVPPAVIKCSGCSGPYEERWRNCQRCNLVACQRKRGQESCGGCPEIDECRDHKYLRDFSAYRGENATEGLRRIISGESEAWLREQEKKWSCPRCGSLAMWYDNVCRRCGETLRDKPVDIDGYSK
jgi:predicted RNA-binding Zn-ribbon protein involved in translation (DUF1610 family)